MDSSASSLKKLVVPKIEPEELRIKCESGLVEEHAAATSYQKRDGLKEVLRRADELLASLDAMRVRWRSEDAPKIESNSSELQSTTSDVNMIHTDKRSQKVLEGFEDTKPDPIMLRSPIVKLVRLSASEIAAALSRRNSCNKTSSSMMKNRRKQLPKNRIKCKTNLVKKPAPATPSLTQSLRTIRKRRTNRLLQASLDSMLVHSRSNDASKIENNSSALQSPTNNFFQVARQRIDLFTEKEMEEATDRLGEYLLSTLSQQWLELYTGEEMQQATERLREYLASTLRGISLEEWVAILFGGQCGAL